MPVQISRRGFLAGTAAVGGALALPGISPATAAATPRSPMPEDLAETGPLQRRWLSLPDSRIVVNPFDFNTNLTPAQYNNGPQLPLHVGYYAGDAAHDLRDLLGIYQRPPSATGGYTVVWQDDFSTLDSAWTADAWLDRQIVDGQLQLTVQPGGPVPWGFTQQWVSVDLDKAPYVQISVTQADGQWGLKVNDGTLPSDVALEGGTTQTGTFTFNIAAATGWTGTKRFEIRLAAVGVGQPVLIDWVRILGVNTALFGATDFSTTWRPDRLPWTGTYPNGADVAGDDFLFNPDVVVRDARITATSTDATWILTGRYQAPPTWDPARRTLTVAGGGYAYAITTTARPTGEPAYFGSALDLVAWTNQQTSAGDSGYWAIPIAPPQRLILAAGFATGPSAVDNATRRAADALARERVDANRILRHEFWQRVLATVPAPQRFDITDVPLYGVTAEDVRHTYYAAWVFAVANTLPAMPETGYNYPQFAAGKPSLWAFGPAGARPSDSWESFLMAQYYAYYDPATAWAAYRGLMSLVGPDGAFGGEGLPTHKAATALILYSVTSDRDSLAGIYPALKRNLMWEGDHLYWLPPGQTGDPDSRDAAFVVPLLIDMAYASDIAEILGLSNDVPLWHTRRQQLLQQYLPWFWALPTSEPVEYYETTTGARNPGVPLWVTIGLHVDLLGSGPYLDGLKRLFADNYDPAKVFAGFDSPNPKYPELAQTLYGLLDRGMVTEAASLANASIRDVTRANAFSEVYASSGDTVKPTGVRPSVFGDLVIIDFVLIKNGYRVDQAHPAFVRITNDTGGITNLTLRGKQLNIRLDPAAGTVDLSGSYVRQTPACQTITAPIGTTVTLSPGCATG